MRSYLLKTVHKKNRRSLSRRKGGNKNTGSHVDITVRLQNPKTLTLFARKVYRAALSIPMGQTRTYQWVASRIGKPGASRAVGQALRRNPFPLLIPCHRVIARSGAWGGYSQGISAKRLLLCLERDLVKVIKNTPARKAGN